MRAARSGDLAAAVDELLRFLSAHAAVVGAVFEARAVRLAEPLVPDVFLVGRLARGLSCCGIGTSFGPSLTPAPAGAAVCVGVSGLERRIGRLFRERAAWRQIPL